MFRTSFDVYTVVVLRRPTDAPDMTDDELDALQSRHLAYRAELVRQGVHVVNGPFREQSDPSYRGMSIFACDAAEAARLSEGDPSVAAVRLRSASAGRCPMTDRPPQRRTPSTCGLRRLAGRPVNGSVGPAVQDEFVAGRGLVVNPINSGHPHCHGGESLRADDT